MRIETAYSLRSIVESATPASSPADLALRVLVSILVYVFFMVALVFYLQWLRGRAARWDAERQHLFSRVRKLNNHLKLVADSLGQEVSEQPYGKHYAEAREKREYAEDAIAAILRDRASRQPAAAIPQAPRQLVVVFPVTFLEIWRRWHWKMQTYTLGRSLGKAETAPQLIAKISKKIAGLGLEEKDVFSNFKKQALDLQGKLNKAIRVQNPMTEEQDVLVKTFALLDQVDTWLAADNPAKVQVVKAYAERVRIKEYLDRVETGLRSVMALREQATQGLTTVTKLLETLQTGIIEEEASGRLLPVLKKQAEALHQELGHLRSRVTAGAYEPALSDQAGLVQRIQDQQKLLNDLLKLRGWVTQAHHKALGRITEIQNWLKNDLPTVYELDLTRPLITEAARHLTELEKAARYEEIEQFSRARLLNKELEDFLNKARKSRQNFEKHEAAYQRWRDQHDSLFGETLSRAEEAIRHLHACHAAYWRALSPETLEVARTKLDTHWLEAIEHMKNIKESELEHFLEGLMKLDQERDQLAKGCTLAERQAQQMSDDRQRAQLELGDMELLSELDRCSQISRESGEVDLRSKTESFEERFTVLSETVKANPENYAGLLINLQSLRSDIKAFIAEYEKRVGLARQELVGLQLSLGVLRGDLFSFVNHASLEFGETANKAIQAIDEWLADSLSVEQAMLSEQESRLRLGQQVERTARSKRDEIKKDIEYFLKNLNNLEEAMDKAHKALSDAESVLNRGARWNSLNWTPHPLLAARDCCLQAANQLQIIKTPLVRYTPVDALEKIERARELASEAQWRAYKASGECQKQINELLKLEQKLQDAFHEADKIPLRSFQRDWRKTRKNIAKHEDHLKQAVNYEKAHQVLKSALDEAIEFFKDVNRRKDAGVQINIEQMFVENYHERKDTID